jgi:high-affinity iron transporter
MVSGFIIMFREMLEMSLVLGVLFVVTRPVPTARRWIIGGSFIGFIGASFVAAFMTEMETSLQGNGEYVFNAVVLALAAVMIAWTVVWMGRHGRELSMRMQKVGHSVAIGELPKTALMLVALTAVMREGSEAVFFIWGAAVAVPHDGMNMTIGAVLGAVAAIVLGYVIYKGLLRVPVNLIFRVIGWLLVFLASGMAGRSAGELVDIGALPGVIDPLWDASKSFPSDSGLGQFLNIMVGYSDSPSAMQVGVFVVSLVVMIWLYLHYARPVVAQPLDQQDEDRAQNAHRQEAGDQPQAG